VAGAASPVTFNCPADLRDELNRRAAKQDTTFEAVVVIALREHLGTGHGVVVAKELVRARNVAMNAVADGKDPIVAVAAHAGQFVYVSPLAELLRQIFASLDYSRLVSRLAARLAASQPEKPPGKPGPN
jgi:hypothetical protein